MATKSAILTPETARDAQLVRLLQPLIAREIAGIAAIDAAIEREVHPDYVVMFHDTKREKQANVEQMATLIRMRGGVPPEHGGLRKLVMKTQTALSERLGGLDATLRAMRMAELELLKAYTKTLDTSEGLTRRALRRALGRTVVHWHVLTAHLAQRTGTRRDIESLPESLDRYFAGPEAKACMRCHLDRRGTRRSLERRDPHPYTYVCAACHDEVRREFPDDLASQMGRWPESVQEARVLQRALGRPSKLNAIHTVLRPLSGLTPDQPVPATAKAWAIPQMAPPPTPRPGEPAAVRWVQPHSAAESSYVDALFDFRSLRSAW